MENEQKAFVPNIPEELPPPPNMKFFGRPDVQTLFIDKFVFVKRPDGMLITSGIQGVPGLEIEQLRFLMTEEHAKRFLDSLAKLLDFYPVKETKQEVPVKHNTKTPASKKKTAAKQIKTVAQKKQKS